MKGQRIFGDILKNHINAARAALICGLWVILQQSLKTNQSLGSSQEQKAPDKDLDSDIER